MLYKLSDQINNPDLKKLIKEIQDENEKNILKFQ